MEVTTVANALEEYAINLSDKIVISTNEAGETFFTLLNQVQEQNERVSRIKRSEDYQTQQGNQSVTLDEAFVRLEAKVRTLFNEKRQV